MNYEYYKNTAKKAYENGYITNEELQDYLAELTCDQCNLEE